MFADVRAVDHELMTFTVGRLSDARHAAAIAAARSQVAERLAQVNTEIAQCEQHQQALSDRLGRRQISLDAFDVANEPLVADLARLTAERDALSGGNPQGSTEALSVEVLTEQWLAGSPADRRAMLLQAAGRDQLLIFPATKRGPRFDRTRIKLRNPDGTVYNIES